MASWSNLLFRPNEDHSSCPDGFRWKTFLWFQVKCFHPVIMTLGETPASCPYGIMCKSFFPSWWLHVKTFFLSSLVWELRLRTFHVLKVSVSIYLSVYPSIHNGFRLLFFSGSDCGDFTCSQRCQHGGICTAPDQCTCRPGYTGRACSTKYVRTSIFYKSTSYASCHIALWNFSFFP